MQSLRVAAIQLTSSDSTEDNLERSAVQIAEAVERGATLVALPENFSIMPQQEVDRLAVAEPASGGPVQRFLSETAAQHGIVLVGGTLPHVPDGAHRPRAWSPVYGPDGNLLAAYEKIHLFDVELPNGEAYRESDAFDHGERPVVCDAAGLKLGLSICYDLRFPELYRHLADLGAELVTVPAAFTEATGRVHWECLLRTRAIENQCFVIAPAQQGTHVNGRRTWGHTMIIDPWGEVLALCEEGEGV
ncbi:unnamed protein product, partial [Cyprideis torosa]